MPVSNSSALPVKEKNNEEIIKEKLRDIDFSSVNSITQWRGANLHDANLLKCFGTLIVIL